MNDFPFPVIMIFFLLLLYLNNNKDVSKEEAKYTQTTFVMPEKTENKDRSLSVILSIMFLIALFVAAILYTSRDKYQNASNTRFNSKSSKVKNITIVSKNNSKTSDFSQMFANCPSVSSIPAGLFVDTKREDSLRNMEAMKEAYNSLENKWESLKTICAARLK